MRALKVNCGLDITLDLDDKEKANRGELLECNFVGQENLKLIEIYPSDLFSNRLSEIINLKELK